MSRDQINQNAKPCNKHTSCTGFVHQHHASCSFVLHFLGKHTGWQVVIILLQVPALQNFPDSLWRFPSNFLSRAFVLKFVWRCELS